MFGISKEDVAAIVRSEVSKFEEKFLKDQMASDAEFAGVLNERVKEIPSQMALVLKESAAEFKAQVSALDSRVTFLERELKKKEQVNQATTKAAADNFDTYMQRLIKMGTTVERVVSLVEAGEVTRTELVKQVVKNAETARAQSHEALGRLDTTMVKMLGIFEEQMHLSNQSLAVLKSVSKNLMDMMVVEEDDVVEPTTKKKKAVRK